MKDKVYTSRVVGVGNYEGCPLVGFTLASRSIPFREFRIDEKKGKINVFPRRGYEGHETNQDPEVDNYSLIRTRRLDDGRRFMVVFNGHMCKRTEGNIKDGMNPMTSLDLTLLDFRGAPNDARIGGVSFMDAQGNSSFYLGVNDRDRGEKRVSLFPNSEVGSIDNKFIFIYDKDTRFAKVCEIKRDNLSSEGVAEYLHHNLLGDREIDFSVATGVAIMKPNSFELGVYNISDLEMSIIEDRYNEGKKS